MGYQQTKSQLPGCCSSNGLAGPSLSAGLGTNSGHAATAPAFQSDRLWQCSLATREVTDANRREQTGHLAEFKAGSMFEYIYIHTLHYVTLDYITLHYINTCLCICIYLSSHG